MSNQNNFNSYSLERAESDLAKQILSRFIEACVEKLSAALAKDDKVAVNRLSNQAATYQDKMDTLIYEDVHQIIFEHQKRNDPDEWSQERVELFNRADAAFEFLMFDCTQGMTMACRIGDDVEFDSLVKQQIDYANRRQLLRLMWDKDEANEVIREAKELSAMQKTLFGSTSYTD